MDFRNLLLGAAAFCLALVAAAPGPANAAVIVSGGSAGSIPGGSSNELLGPLGLANPLAGTYGSQISSNGLKTLKYEFLGFEAGFHNRFSVNNALIVGDGVFDTEDVVGNLGIGPFAGPLDTFVSDGVNGLLNFAFLVNLDGSPAFVANGLNPADGAGVGVNFFTHVLPDGSVLLFLDDGGAGPDDNHDDMLVRISEVPEPATLLILGLALLALGLFARRREATPLA